MFCVWVYTHISSLISLNACHAITFIGLFFNCFVGFHLCAHFQAIGWSEFEMSWEKSLKFKQQTQIITHGQRLNRLNHSQCHHYQPSQRHTIEIVVFLNGLSFLLLHNCVAWQSNGFGWICLVWKKTPSSFIDGILFHFIVYINLFNRKRLMQL